MADFLPGFSREENLLPKEGGLKYFSAWLSAGDADRCFAGLLENPAWSSDRIRMFGKTIVTDRKVIWFGDDGVSYTIQGSKNNRYLGPCGAGTQIDGGTGIRLRL